MISPLRGLYVLLFIAIVFAGCKSKKLSEGYRVTSYDSKSGEWTVLRNGTFDGQYLVKRMILVCESYQWGNHEIVKGPTECDLHVGQLLSENAFPPKDKQNTFTDIDEMDADTLSIIIGSGDDRVIEQFHVLSNEVINSD